MTDQPKTTTFEIKRRWGLPSIKVEIDAKLDGEWYGLRLGAAVKVAINTGADLTDADLTGADLTDADLTGADLTGADLTDAVLTRADLTRADLTRADLTRADLTGADLTDADLTPIEADFYHVLVTARAEAPGLLRALREGRVNGSTYSGECACLVGTIANIRGVHVDTLYRNSARPIERFFLSIHRGDTPETNQHAKIAEEWLLKFLGGEPAKV